MWGWIFVLGVFSSVDAIWYNHYRSQQSYPRCPPVPPQPADRDTCEWIPVKDSVDCIIRWQCVAKEPKELPCPQSPARPEASTGCKWVSIRDRRGCVIDFVCEPVTEPPCPRQPRRPLNSERCVWTAVKDAKGCVLDFQCEPRIQQSRVVQQQPRFRPVYQSAPTFNFLPYRRRAFRPSFRYNQEPFIPKPIRPSFRYNQGPFNPLPRFDRTFKTSPSWAPARRLPRPVPHPILGLAPPLPQPILEEPFVPEPAYLLEQPSALPFPFLRDTAEASKLSKEDSVVDVVVGEKQIRRRRKCEDRNEQCEYWESIGECDKNPTFMLYNCRRTCNACHIARRRRPIKCEDRNEQCDFWAFKGECEENPAYMRRNCRLSCSFCLP